MHLVNEIKAGMKNCLPWRLRYEIKLLEARWGKAIPAFMKYHNEAGKIVQSVIVAR